MVDILDKKPNSIISIFSKSNCSLSSILRFSNSCDKFSIQKEIVDFANIKNYLDNIEDNQYIMIVNCNYAFYINNPSKLIENDEKDFYYSNFRNMEELLNNDKLNQLYFFGKKYKLLSILNNNSTDCINCDDNIIYKNLKEEDNSIYNCDSIFINGKMNTILLNKYENYNLRYIQTQQSYNFRIRVNIMMYENDSFDCYNSIKTIDYPKELLDINIYTKSDLSINDSVKIHKLNEENAYENIYYYCNEYDYIWIINSNNIITKTSILKDCLDSGRLVCGGLTLKKGTIYSNFWGDITSDGWYKRSNDYLDIVNCNIINIWNIPYITGNILINRQIFNYNLFKNRTFKDFDLILCHNLRLLNESMYLLNNKLYGHIIDKTDTNSVYNVNDLNLKNISFDKIFTTEYLKFFYENVNIFEEVEKNSDVWNFPFFKPEFCDFLVEIAEKNGNWSGGVNSKGKVDKRIGAVENYPTQDIHMNQIGLEIFWKDIVNRHFKKIMAFIYRYTTKDYNIAFVAKYDAENSSGQTKLDPHHDASVYTTNIALNDSTEYEGGGVFFHSKNLKFLNKNKGYLTLHPGRVTHYHEAIQITKGKRYILVSFNN
jgi:hypothetical protein